MEGGALAEAVEEFSRVLQQQPDHATVSNTLHKQCILIVTLEAVYDSRVLSSGGGQGGSFSPKSQPSPPKLSSFPPKG